MRKTKIICTIGPASDSEEVLTQMCEAGMNVARLNFSHGTHEEHQEKIDIIKKVREKLDLPIAIMLDTKGPEYRIKTFENKKVTLEDGAMFSFTTEDVVGNEERVSVNYDHLIDDLEVGDTILVNNGLVIFEVKELKEKEAVCLVKAGGELSDRKSMNFPNRVLQNDYLSEQDKEDLLFGIRNEVDFVAASFVSTKQDILDLRNFLSENGGDDIELIAKIEARDHHIPLMERLKFLSITASNLDEFFMIRVASLMDQVNAGYAKKDIAGMTPKEQVDAILKKCHDFVDVQYSTYSRSFLPSLKKAGLEIVTEYEKLTPEQAEYVDTYFKQEVFPVLTPMAVDSSRPFPLIRNKSLNIGALLMDKKKKDTIDFATVQVPSVLPRVVTIPSEQENCTAVILLEQIYRSYRILHGEPYHK